MPFESTEVHWFSDDRVNFWNLFTELPETGTGTEEALRTDYYLRCQGVQQTGTKFRKGKHEWKLKYKPDEPVEYGLIQYWKKWSTEEKQDILTTI